MTKPPEAGIRVLLSQEQIRQRVRDLAEEIAKDFRDQCPVLIGVLQGAFVFMADLIRQLEIPVAVDFMRVSSYGRSLVTSGEVRILLDLTTPIANRPVILVEDIVDTGLTVQYLRSSLLARNPLSLSVCALLQKPSNTISVSPVEYLGFTIPNHFVVGYGLDYAGRYRELPHIGVLPESLMAQL
jgi:hypoxanthine phosphoribosyltransferase